jgi:hypothetical protein
MLLAVGCIRIRKHKREDEDGEEGKSFAEERPRLPTDEGRTIRQSFGGRRRLTEDRRPRGLTGIGRRKRGCIGAGFGPCSSGTASCWLSSLWLHVR